MKPDSTSKPSKPKPTVVGIGASAGGLKALKSFFDYLPADSGLAFVVVVHLSPAMKENGITCVLTQFGNGADAVRALCATPSEDVPLPDAILLDLNTPRTDGFDALLKLKQSPHLAEVPIAILTSSRSRSDKHRASIQGVRYVEKPSQLREFLSSVGQIVKEMLATGGAA